MKLIIAGSRDFTHFRDEFIDECVKAFDLYPDFIVSGVARGVDMAGEHWADRNGIPITFFHAEWDKYGGKAGPIRNKKMAVFGDALLLIWDGSSVGSANMKQEMLALDKPVYEMIVRKYIK